MKKHVRWDNRLDIAETYAKEEYDRTIDKVLISQNIQMNKKDRVYTSPVLFDCNNILFLGLFILFVSVFFYSSL